MGFLSVGRMWFPVTTLGYGRRFGIWLQGCRRDCPNCISPEFKSIKDGILISTEEIIQKLIKTEKIDGLTVSGGEPFDQADGLSELVGWFSANYNDDILIFTGYTLKELRNKKNESIEKILNTISVLVDGTYIDELNDGKGIRGSSNQNIYVFKNLDRYPNADKQERKVQGVLLPDNRLWIIGIPPLRS